jgi:hypothetical protein
MDVSTDTRVSRNGELIATDWDEVSFPLRLLTIWEEAGQRNRRLPVVLDGAEGDDFRKALEAVRARPSKQREGRTGTTAQRERSRANREYLIARSTGVCPCCARDLAAELPRGRGLSGLQVHHLTRVGSRTDWEFDTDLDELAVVCATCHVLLTSASADSEVDLHPDALRQVIRPGSRRLCIRCGHGVLRAVSEGRKCARCLAVWSPQLRPKL